MRSAIRASACAVALFTALCAPAVAAPHGQLAAVVDGQLVMANSADGSGLRTLPVGGPITELAFSPVGNRLAIVRDGSISVIEVITGRHQLDLGVRGSNIAWSADGTRIVYVRDAVAYTVPSRGGTEDRHSLVLPDGVTALGWAPGLDRAAFVIDGRLELAEDVPVSGAPAWSRDGSRIAFANREGLHTLPAAGGATTLIASAPAVGPRWAPDSSVLVYGAANHVRIVPAGGGAPRTVISGREVVTAVDWQPCTSATRSCESAKPPECAATAVSVTTHTDEPVGLPAPPCSDPANRAVTLVVVRSPEHGTLDGWRYTPAPGFFGQDSISYRVNNGATESENVRLTIFVVPRAAPVAVAPRPQPAPRGAPFLTATRMPRLNARRQTVVRLTCDQDCTFGVRLTARLRGGKRIQGRRVIRKRAARTELRLRLRLPRKPAGAVKRVWVTGRVTGASGESRRVRLPVRRPR